MAFVVECIGGGCGIATFVLGVMGVGAGAGGLVGVDTGEAAAFFVVVFVFGVVAVVVGRVRGARGIRELGVCLFL